MKGNRMMTSQSQSQAQNARKGYWLEPIYFFNKEPQSFEDLSFFFSSEHVEASKIFKQGFAPPNHSVTKLHPVPGRPFHTPEI